MSGPGQMPLSHLEKMKVSARHTVIWELPWCTAFPFVGEIVSTEKITELNTENTQNFLS